MSELVFLVPATGIARDAEGIPCPCGGYADRVTCNPEELQQFGCIRDVLSGHECCARAFVCRVCGTRLAGRAIAPEMR